MPTDFVELAQASHSAGAFEASVLAALEREIGADVAFFVVRGLEGQPTVRGLEPRVIAQALGGGGVYERELLLVKEAALRARGVAVDTAVLGERRVRESAYFRDIAEPVGGRHSLLAYLSWRSRPFAAVMLGRTGAAFTEGDVRRVERLVPGLSVARAAFGLPALNAALPLPAARGWLERIGWGGARLRASERSGHGSLLVRDRDGFREMVASEGGQELVWTRAALEDGARSGWPYVDLFHVALGLARGRSSALFVGCGGGVAVRQFARCYPGIAIEVVERDARVIELARTWFDLGRVPELTVHVADGAEFVAQARPGSWDVAVIDAFDARRLVQEVTESSFFHALERGLRPGGALAFNMIGSLAGNDAVARVARAIGAVFEDVRLLPVVSLDETYAPETLRNVVIVALKTNAA
jgi:spermidine synthase